MSVEKRVFFFGRLYKYGRVVKLDWDKSQLQLSSTWAHIAQDDQKGLAGDGRKVKDRPRGFFFLSFFSSPSFFLFPFVKVI